MKKGLLINTAIGMTLMGGLTAQATYPPNGSLLLSNTGKQEKIKSVRPYRGKKVWDINAFNTIPGKERVSPKGYAVTDPADQFTDVRLIDYIEGPDGSVWYYTAEYDVDRIEWSEWYIQESIKAYSFDIYDSSFNYIGTVKDKVELREGETGVAHAVLDPTVTLNFFNGDDSPEIMVYLATNTEMFVNNYYNKVYTIGGEKDAEGNDVPLMTIEGRCVDAFNAAGPGEPENFYLTFVGSESADNEDAADFVEFVKSYYQPITTYGKDVDGNGPVEIITKKIFLVCVPGDTTDGIYFISKPMNGKAYIIYSQYEKPYMIDPTGGAENEEPTPDNSLVNELYVIEGNSARLLSTTKIPVVQIESDENLMYSFYSIGSVAWKNDIDMVVNGTIEAPAYLVARDVMNAATYEEALSSYEIYGNDGKLIKEIAQDTDGIVVFDNNGEIEPEALFVFAVDDPNAELSNYTFKVAGLYTGNTIFEIDQLNGGDPISASCNRIKGADGKYKYGFEMTYYDKDSEGNEYARVAWFNEDGSMDRIDRINIGQDLMAAMVNMYSDALNPYLYDTDDAMEYAVLVKRIHDNTTRNEFIIADDNGDWFAKFSEEDGKGDPRSFTILPGEEARLMMVYQESRRYNVDIYDLPFLAPAEDPNASIDSIEVGGTKVIYSNNEILAPACNITVYSTGGANVAKGYGALSVDNLANGIYVVSVTDGSGNKTDMKILKK